MAHKFGKRVVLFSIVGVSGIVVNMGILWILTHFVNIHYALASPLAIELSIINNFIWNDRFTWRGRRRARKLNIWNGLLRFNIVSWIAGSMNWLLLILFTEVAGIYYLWANLLAIAIAAAMNFFLNEKWTFKAMPDWEEH
ncbi:MAG: GtrA family protein [Candidatus Marinimicrobia bacterium]|nr:GtrA family protein [Candidatus Neomarinimicrobiota bacterium]MCF7839261.1 GtrA family protein [Candidatus Neomarinimicrobiota bacterium]MCF7902207.1 GtrA family protein [Candidatus Neomarinimicrobiota bacterium]